jgi:hypothetical protein
MPGFYEGPTNMMRGAVIAVLLVLLPSYLRAEARVALLIGNQDYRFKVGPLKNPRSDVQLVGAALKQLGFEITILEDADYRTMDVAIKRFVTERLPSLGSAISTGIS